MVKNVHNLRLTSVGFHRKFNIPWSQGETLAWHYRINLIDKPYAAIRPLVFWRGGWKQSLEFLPLPSSAARQSSVTRSISPAALTPKADLGSINCNAEDKMLIRCSRCRSISVRKSKRRGFFEKALSVLVRPYRCKGCYHRFFPLFQTVLANARTSDNMEAGQADDDLRRRTRVLV